jgi:hypothetical protein
MSKLDVHYVSFIGNLETTACGLPLTDDLEAAIDGDEHGLVTILATSATCSGCRGVIAGERPATIRASAFRPAPAVTAAL